MLLSFWSLQGLVILQYVIFRKVVFIYVAAIAKKFELILFMLLSFQCYIFYTALFSSSYFNGDQQMMKALRVAKAV